MATFKTPGVYVQEITKFPPSVAPVATAIPAFIGYTEKATKLSDGDLSMVPTRITSMVDYEQYFGLAQNEPDINVEVNTSGNIIVSNDTPSDYKMYYALQMYFANGGGPCYIVSVGIYGSTVELGNATTGLLGGLAEIRKQDEPTLLVTPDSQALSNSNFNALNQDLLEQCADLQDRFSIMDTKGDGPSAISDFRDGIGVDNLKYGACYYPFLNTILDYRYEDSAVDVTNNAIPIPQTAIAESRTEIDALLVDYNEAVDSFQSTTGNLANKSSLISDAQTALSKLNAIKSQFDSIVDQGRSVTESGDGAGDDQAVLDAAQALDDEILSSIDNVISTLESRIDKLNSDSTDTKVGNTQTSVVTLLVGGETPPSNLLNVSIDGGTLETLADTVDSTLDTFNGGAATSTKLDLLKDSDNELYNRIKAAISDFPIKMAPSSAMAGIYARVDNAVGVWKAPANVTVQFVESPTKVVSNEFQEDMNVTSSGKSVNAIRSFVGKGTLVWGARTLAGNDNEWRYIPVRRLFNFVEESVSESTEQYVFEPNVASTWLRLRTQIENFLTDIWKSGALAGATPEQAFYVRVGLGQTMTSQDILEGKMIVEIGMAAVRPAEFIVLKFSHKMQEA